MRLNGTRFIELGFVAIELTPQQTPPPCCFVMNLGPVSSPYFFPLFVAHLKCEDLGRSCPDKSCMEQVLLTGIPVSLDSVSFRDLDRCNLSLCQATFIPFFVPRFEYSSRTRAWNSGEEGVIKRAPPLTREGVGWKSICCYFSTSKEPILFSI